MIVLSFDIFVFRFWFLVFSFNKFDDGMFENLTFETFFKMLNCFLKLLNSIFCFRNDFK